MDNLLLQFVEATDEEQADLCLVTLIDEHAVPIVREILGSSLRFYVNNNSAASTQDANDLFNDIITNLLSRLRNIRRDRAQGTVADFRGYIAATAYNACNHYLREKYPRRSRLKNRLRYLVSHDATFALWTIEASGLICGFAEWRHKAAAVSPQRLFEKIRHDPVEWAQSAGLPSVGIDRAQLPSLLNALFQSCGSPLKLDDLVNIVADICHEKDQPVEPLDSMTQLAAPTLDFDILLEQQHVLALLWREVCNLPYRQRLALLLNFKDTRGQDLVSLLPYTRTATIEQIAAALDFPLAEFLSLWNKLPLDDVSIAGLLGATRQQVINLRKCARERLERRMSAVIAKSSAAK